MIANTDKRANEFEMMERFTVPSLGRFAVVL